MPDFDEEREYLADFAYIAAEKEHEEWLFWKEDVKFEKERKKAKITVKKQHDKVRTKPTPVPATS